MQTSEISDPLFRRAVEAIDNGDINILQDLLTRYPALIRQRLEAPNEGYFKQPYLLWFVADNPIRIEKLPANMVDITRILIEFAKKEAADALRLQLDYALELVATGFTPRACGVQLEMMDALFDAGAKPCPAINALTQGNKEAGEYLIRRGSELTLTAAACLNDLEKVMLLEPAASDIEKGAALAAAALYGYLEVISWLLSRGIDPNVYPDPSAGFHSHATALHQAVASGSLDGVKALVEAGANTTLRDKMFDGTPLDWALYLQANEPLGRRDLSAIINYLAV
jgi:peptide-methionine (S)-S-oxide reductase